MSITNKHSDKENTFHISIKSWSIDERPREKLFQKGEQSLSNAELLAILIRSGFRKISALDIARLLLDKYSLMNLSSLDTSKLKNLTIGNSSKGKPILLGETRASTIAAAFALNRRISLLDNPKKKRILQPKDVVSLIEKEFAQLTHEEFHIVLLNSANIYITHKKISQGILNASLVHPREVFKEAITEKAASIILVHNHPSGNTEPSKEDISITKQLVEVGMLMEIPIQDHIIIAGNNYTSFVERRLL